MEPRSYSCGDHLTINRNLKEKISEMKSDLNRLQQKLYHEKQLLNRRKQEILVQYGMIPESNKLSWNNDQKIEDKRSEATIPLNKEYLRDIERKCESELTKLNDYIFNVNQLKSYWIKMREADRSDSTKTDDPKKDVWKTSSQKRYSKGKVFFVDSDMY